MQTGNDVGSSGDSVAGSRNKASRKTEKEPFKLAILDQDEQGKEPAKKKKKRKEATPAVQETFKSLLTGIFTIVGNINPVWMVQESEVDLVVEPATRIFERYVADKAEETSDIISLVVALSILMVPRIVLSVSLKKEGSEKNDKKGEIRPGSSEPLPKFADAYQGGNDIIS